MKMIKKLSVIIALLSIPAVITLYAECYGEETFRARPINGVGNWERGDGRCNLDSDCGPGQECSAFGLCQACN